MEPNNPNEHYSVGIIRAYIGNKTDITNIKWVYEYCTHKLEHLIRIYEDSPTYVEQLTRDLATIHKLMEPLLAEEKDRAEITQVLKEIVEGDRDA